MVNVIMMISVISITGAHRGLTLSTCSKTLEELESLGHTGAINWIRSFETVKNGRGVLLTEDLKRKNLHWYEMSLNSKFDLGLLINPDERLFFS